MQWTPNTMAPKNAYRPYKPRAFACIKFLIAYP